VGNEVPWQLTSTEMLIDEPLAHDPPGKLTLEDLSDPMTRAAEDRSNELLVLGAGGGRDERSAPSVDDEDAAVHRWSWSERRRRNAAVELESIPRPPCRGEESGPAHCSALSCHLPLQQKNDTVQ
jgi:hypothetical protein